MVRGAPIDPDRQLLAAAREQAWAQALPRNGLPNFVEERLRPAPAGHAKPWLATMAPAELLLAKSHGMKPLATVSGSCALRYGNGGFDGYLSDEWINLGSGWDRAIARIKKEALAAGANAVVDVRMRSVPLPEPGAADFTLFGTAVRFNRLPPSTDPAVATVSALDFVRLAEMDVVVCGIALGTAYDWLYTPFGMTDTRPGARDLAREVRGQLGALAGNAPVQGLTDFWERIRREAHAHLRTKAQAAGNGVLARTHFGQLIRVRGTLPNYVGRHMVVGTLVERGRAWGRATRQTIEMVHDMREGRSPLLGAAPSGSDDAAIAFLGERQVK